jgi:hypothetical protein
MPRHQLDRSGNEGHGGVIPANALLTPWPDDLAKWETLSADEKKLFARQAEVRWLPPDPNDRSKVIEPIGEE